MKLGIVGKRYEDTKLYINTNQIGESNNCDKLVTCLGGMHNFRLTELEDYRLAMVENGIKKAYIIEDSSTSTRTSYTYTTEPSIIDDLFIDSLADLSWIHFAYIDDLDDITAIKKLTKPYSIDFCMNKDRRPYVEYMSNASVVFDSRERKDLYKDIYIITPIVLHDEKGCEVIVDGKVVCTHECETLENVSVNGAGDIYAKFFLETHFLRHYNVESASKYALESTTSYLKYFQNLGVVNEEV